jgi:hypothetical protein
MSVATGLLIGSAVASAAGGVASGISRSRAADAMDLTDAERAELERLKRRRSQGGLGLTGAEEATLRQQAEAQQAGVTRDVEAMNLQQMAAQQAGGRAVSGRDLFLQEQAEQGALRGIVQQQQADINRLNQEERQAERARIAQLEGKAQAAEAERRAGRTEAISLGLASVGQVGMVAAQQRADLAIQEAKTPVQPTDVIIQQSGATNPSDFSFDLIPLTTFS